MMVDIKKYQMHIIGFIVAILAVFASMYVWLLTIISPIFVFLILKFFKIWRSKERLMVGIPAILIGIILFFGVFSYQISDISTQNFENSTHTLKATVVPYSTEDASKAVYINTTYSKPTNSSMSYIVKEAKDQRVLTSGEVKGNVLDNVTEFHLTLKLPKGIYAINLTVENETITASALRETTFEIFRLYLYFPGLYLMFLLSSLYALFVFGIHIIRRGQKMGRKYEKKTS